jgi:hypothetical protein
MFLSISNTKWTGSRGEKRFFYQVISIAVPQIYLIENFILTVCLLLYGYLSKKEKKIGLLCGKYPSTQNENSGLKVKFTFV